jgi:hypothetical protein
MFLQLVASHIGDYLFILVLLSIKVAEVDFIY